MTIIRPSAFFLAITLMGAGSFLHAEETFEAQVAKLADENFAVRMEAKKALIEMCSQKPERIDTFFRLFVAKTTDPEQAYIAGDIIRKHFHQLIYCERGVIGINLGEDWALRHVVEDGPGAKAGMRKGLKLVSVAGEPVDGKNPRDIYAIVHSTRPGTKLEMEFVDKDGKKLLYYPVVAPRSTVRSDENVELRRFEQFDEWIEKKAEELKKQAD